MENAFHLLDKNYVFLSFCIIGEEEKMWEKAAERNGWKRNIPGFQPDGQTGGIKLRPARSCDLRKMAEEFPVCRIQPDSAGDPFFQDGDQLVQYRRQQAQDDDGHDQQIHSEELCTHTDTIGYRAVSGSFINYSVARKVDRTLKLFVQGLGSRGYM